MYSHTAGFARATFIFRIVPARYSQELSHTTRFVRTRGQVLIKTTGKSCGCAALAVIARPLPRPSPVLNADAGSEIISSAVAGRMVCRWTPRDTCYHLAPCGIFIAGVNERPDGDRSRCATASDGTQTDTRNFQTNQI